MKPWLFVMLAFVAAISTGETGKARNWKCIMTLSGSRNDVLVMNATLSQRPGSPVARLTGVEIKTDGIVLRAKEAVFNMLTNDVALQGSVHIHISTKASTPK
jgi:hypothetical protein